MGDCSAHFNPDVFQPLTEAKVRVITFAAYTIHVCQVLDMTISDAHLRRSG
jgi:hypothetical protein